MRRLLRAAAAAVIASGASAAQVQKRALDPCALAEREAALDASAFGAAGLTRADMEALEKAGVTLDASGKCLYTKRLSGGVASMECGDRQIKLGLEAVCEDRASREAGDKERQAQAARSLAASLEYQPLSAELIARYKAASAGGLPMDVRRDLNSAYERAVVNYLAPHVPQMRKGNLPPLYDEAVEPWSGDAKKTGGLLDAVESKHKVDALLAERRVNDMKSKVFNDAHEAERKRKEAAVSAQEEGAARCRELRAQFKDDGCRCGALITSSVCLDIQRTLNRLPGCGCR